MTVKTLLSGEDRSLGARALRTLLTPISALHYLGLKIYLLPYRLGLRKRFCLPVPVIAIGNLTSGGTGKTPMAALIGRMLREDNKRVVLLSRGHGGTHERLGGAQIVSRGDGEILLTPEIAGDEPILLAKLLPDVPIIVGRDRRVSGRLALAEFAPEVILLDDALQFWQLERDLDIVLLDAKKPFDNGYLLPRGLLREPPSHLNRAGIVVITRSDQVSELALAALKARAALLAPKALILTAIHAPQHWIDVQSGAIFGIVLSDETPVVAFSGIADGAAFLHSIKPFGVQPIFYCDFGDHHAYNREEAIALVQRAPEAVFVTTEKDVVKLKTLWPENGPRLLALRIAMQVEERAALQVALRRIYGEEHKYGEEHRQSQEH
jgi:tetraacyldisaccharide 4'-kinase